jgi:hypothetical protein
VTVFTHAAALTLALIATASGAASGTTSGSGEVKALADMVERMKAAPRGPFTRLRWFCADGTVHPPRPYPCEERGGGVQHGELGEDALALRAAGYQIANVLADLQPEEFLRAGEARRRLTHLLIERFLIGIDDGWILRRARYYRGALQEEDERAGAQRLLLAMAGDDALLARDFLALRTAARLLPHGADGPSASLVRQLSAALSERDPGFLTLRNKIHVQPGPEDAAAVRAYAGRVDDDALRGEFERLIQAIDALYSSAATAEAMRALARRLKASAPLKPLLERSAAALRGEKDASTRVSLLARFLGQARDAVGDVRSPTIRLALVDLSNLAEAEMFAAASALRGSVASKTRSQQMALVGDTLHAIYGAGLLSVRERTALATELASLREPTMPLVDYKRVLDYLARVPGWSARRLHYHFGAGMHGLAEVEPRAARFIEDQLRGSPLFLFADVIDRLTRDANRLAGVRNELDGETVGSGLRALNPGLARGVLRNAPRAGESYDPGGIYILPETESDLPPVAGILTAGAGNPLSHVQLLARNLGIPNVGVDEALLPRLQPMVGAQVVLAVTGRGAVQLTRADARHEGLFKRRRDASEQTRIRPDMNKLDLDRRELLTLTALRARDSGRTVGPKAAKLGELKSSFPDAVAEGLAIPFGIFRALLDRPYENSGKSVFRWMQDSYRALEALPANSPERSARTEAFRKTLYEWILAAPLDADFVRQLRSDLQRVFGKDGSYGVFVRSDTNVEDLPNFTGAGLNLTVPNVVGADAIMAAIPRVWASPFTARAFAWRQSHMDTPEHVYPAVLLMLSVNADKSGVMVTEDIDTGSREWLSVAVNEGVGGAVDGQAAESLRVPMDGTPPRLLSQATADIRRRIDPRGGVTKIPATGTDYVLRPGEIRQLVDLARVLPQRFPAVVDAAGQPVPADIEFGFIDGRLQLFQIRPFLESRQARSNAYLNGLDAHMKDLSTLRVTLNEVPR